MKLSRTIAYGVHAAIQLARLPGGALTPASRLAREGQLPDRFLVQILRYLVTNGVLTSGCGVTGGYSLARPPSQITLRDIVESFDNPLDVHLPNLACMSQNVRSDVVATLEAASEAARLRLQKVTLADLACLGREVRIGFRRPTISQRHQPTLDGIKCVRNPSQ